MLADRPRPRHPDHRPPYLHLIPLAEIIAMALNVKNVYSPKVQTIWNELVKGKSEIEVLVEADLSDLEGEEKVIDAIRAFRSKDVVVEPGGGGRYGRVRLPDSLNTTKDDDQRSLFDF